MLELIKKTKRNWVGLLTDVLEGMVIGKKVTAEEDIR